MIQHTSIDLSPPATNTMTSAVTASADISSAPIDLILSDSDDPIQPRLRGRGRPSTRSSRAAAAADDDGEADFAPRPTLILNTGNKKQSLRPRAAAKRSKAKADIWENPEDLINKEESPLYDAANLNKLKVIPPYPFFIIGFQHINKQENMLTLLFPPQDLIQHPDSREKFLPTGILSLPDIDLTRVISAFQEAGNGGYFDAQFIADARKASQRRANGDFVAFEKARYEEQFPADTDSESQYSDDGQLMDGIGEKEERVGMRGTGMAMVSMGGEREKSVGLSEMGFEFDMEHDDGGGESVADSFGNGSQDVSSSFLLFYPPHL